MSEEEIIKYLKECIEHSKYNFENFGENNYLDKSTQNAIQGLLDLYEKEKEKNKKIEDKKEEIYAIARANYILGQTDERSQWYKKINEKIEEYEKDIKDFVNTDNSGRFTRDKCILTYYVEVLKELIGKEE